MLIIIMLEEDTRW